MARVVELDRTYSGIEESLTWVLNLAGMTPTELRYRDLALADAHLNHIVTVVVEEYMGALQEQIKDWNNPRSIASLNDREKIRMRRTSERFVAQIEQYRMVLGNINMLTAKEKYIMFMDTAPRSRLPEVSLCFIALAAHLYGINWKPVFKKIFSTKGSYRYMAEEYKDKANKFSALIRLELEKRTGDKTWT